MSNLIIEKLLAKTQRTDIPAFRPGDTVRVHVKIKEGDKERVQAFEGVVIKRDNGPQASFTVRKISFGQGVERRRAPANGQDFGNPFPFEIARAGLPGAHDARSVMLKGLIPLAVRANLQ